MDIFGDYNLTGSYLLNGHEGVQRGFISILKNRMVTGLIVDDNKSPQRTLSHHEKDRGHSLIGLAGGERPPKVIVGKISPQLGLQYFKLPIPQLDDQRDDLYWALEGKKINGGLEFKGGWTFIPGRNASMACISFFPGFSGLISQKEITLNILKEFFERSKIKDLPGNIESLESYEDGLIEFPKRGREGKITLEKII